MKKKIIKSKKKKIQLFNISKWKYKKFHYKVFKNKINYKSYYLKENYKKCNYGLQVIEGGYLYSHQLKSLVDTVKKYIKGKASLKVKITCKYLIRKKKTGMRMGKGKGPVLQWMCNIKKGTVIMEVNDYALIQTLFIGVKSKSPLKLKIIKKSI